MKHKLVDEEGLLLKDVLQTIKAYSFAKSPYPVIISLEMNCSPIQQERFAVHCKKILGEENILKLNEEELKENCWEKLPSPHELQHTYIIKVPSLILRN